MSEKRFFTKVNKNGRNVIIDKECHIEIIDLTLACEVLNRLDLKLKTYNEQLKQLQDLCGESDGENAKLRIENKRLQKKNEQLKNKLNDEYITCEQKFSCNNCKYHKDEKRDDIEHFSYPYSYCERKRCRLGSKERNWEGSWEQCKHTCFVPNEQTKRYIHNSY